MPHRPCYLRSLQLLALLATAGTVRAQQAATFSVVTTYSTGGSQPGSLAVADINGDSKLDLLVINSSSSTAGVLLGTGTGSFSTVTTFNTGTSSRTNGLAVADVNGDGKPDLLTANFGLHTAGVLLGTGTGSFGTATTYSSGDHSAPVSITVADVNGDSKPDLLTANQASNTVGVLLGTGTGSFGAVTTFSTGANSSPAGIAVADVNGDGKLDLLAANTNSTAGVLLGTGTGSFGTVTTFSTGTSSLSNSIAVADVNGDGKLDLLTANYNSNMAGVLLGTGTGSFGAVTQVSTGGNSQPYAIAVADVNADGKPDLLTANLGTNTAGILLNTTPRLVMGTLLPVSNTSVGLALAPNPALHGAATLTGVTPGLAVQVFDTLGRVAATATADATGTAALSGLIPGLYLVRAGSGYGRLAVE